jgi:hypothetical protein
MIEVGDLSTNYIGTYYFTLSFIMSCMGNLNANFGVKPLSFIMIGWIIYKNIIGLV